VSLYLLWRRGCPDPLALITHDRQVRRAYAGSQEAVEHLLDRPSDVALAECFVTAQEPTHPTKVTPMGVFLDMRKLRKGEVDVRLEERPVKKPRLVKLRLTGKALKMAPKVRVQSRVPEGSEAI
jgi:hypothetical protein